MSLLTTDNIIIRVMHITYYFQVSQYLTLFELLYNVLC